MTAVSSRSLRKTYQGKSMSLDKKDFYGKEVTDAIKKACEELGAAQEQLDIDVIETGSTGIFGLIRKKAHIKASVKMVQEVAEEQVVVSERKGQPKKPVQPSEKPKKKVVPESVADTEPEDDDNGDDLADPYDDGEDSEVQGGQVSQESLDIVKKELGQLLELMGYPSEIQVESSGTSVHCCIQGGFEEPLTGQDGKTLDSLQYILRKIIARKISERIRLSIDIGDFRERRQKELAQKALELAKLVKEDGKTQVLAALNPSERRVVHMALQEDKEIRSRSVGEGLFKKILIYKPGKGKKNGGGSRRQHGSRGHRAKSGKTEGEK
jgi:spoIIIJ-associated protein